METFLFIRNNYSVDSMCFWRGWVILYEVIDS
jgi:hypothetical protein